ncbi:membrane protein FAM174B [Neosynchiropus ocellatus]
MLCHLALTLVAVALGGVTGEPPTLPSASTRVNLTTSPALGEHPAARNATDVSVGSRISSLLTHLPTLKVIVLFICVLTAALVTCLLIKVYRSGRRIRKTRKYDIITTPAERVEMTPLNEDEEDEDDSTLFDVKYRSVHP